MEQAGVALIAQGSNAYIGDLKSATSATNAFVDATEKGGGRVSAAGQVMIGGLRQVGAVAVDAFGKALKATAAFIGDSIDLAGDFEQGMLDFQAVAGKDVDTDGLEEFRDLFIDIGKRLPVSTTEVQQAATEMVKGGIDPAIIAAGGLERNIQFAAAAMDGDLVKAAEISSKVLGGWVDATASAEQKTAFLTQATDLLSKAANASATDVEGLSLGIFNSQGIAKTAGVEFGDLTTTLALLAPRFASSSEAGNSLKNVIARLQPTTDPAASAMEGLGLYTEETGSAFYDLQGNFVGFEKASQLLKESLIGLTKEQQAQALQIIFGNDAMGAAAALADGGGEAYRAMAEAMASANGVMDTAAIKQGGFNTSLDNTMGSVEALKITIGSALLPVLGELLDTYISPLINAVTSAAEAFFEAGGMSSEFGESVGALATAIGLPGEAVQDLVFTIQDLVSYFQAVVEDGDTLNDFFADLPSSIQPVVMVIGNLITFFQDTSSASDELGSTLADLSGIWNNALATVTDVANGYLSIAQSILPIVTRFWAEHGTEISAFLQSAYDKIITIVNTALDLYDAIVPKALGSVADWIDKHATGIQSVLSGAWKVISGIIDAALTLIEGTLKIALAVISGDWSKAWTDLQAMSVRVTLDIGQIIGGFFDIIAGLFNTSMADILQMWQNNWDMAVNIVTKTDWLAVGSQVVTGIISGIEGAAGSLFSTLQNLATGALNAAKNALGISSPSKVMADLVGVPIIQGIITGLQTASPALMRGISEIGGQVSDTFTDTDIIDALRELGLDAMAGFGKGLKSGVSGVMSIVNSAANSVEDAFKNAFQSHSPSERMVPVGESITQGIMQGLAGMWPTLMSTVSSLSEDLIDQVADIGQQVQGMIADSFGATASIDRQLAKNLGSMKDVLPAYQQYVSGTLKQAEADARKFLDPAEGAKYFQMRSKQIFEYAKLQKDLADQQQASDDAVAVQSAEMAKSDQLRAQIAADLTDEQRTALEEQLKVSESLIEKDAIRARLAADLTDAERGTILRNLAASQVAQDAAIAARHEAQAMIPILQQQMSLINMAHQAELSQFDANKAANGNPFQDLIDQMHQLFNNEKKAALEEQYANAKTDAERARIQKELEAAVIPVNDTGIGHDLQALIQMLTQIFNIPHLAGGGPAERGQPYWVGEHGPELFWPQMNGMVSPAASSQQMAARANTTNYNGQVGNTYNMPVYTNQSPQVMQQSWAIMQASMP